MRLGRTILILSIAGALACAHRSTEAPELAHFQDLAAAREAASKTGGLLLVDFYAVWCGPCKRFTKEVDLDATLRGALANEVIFHEIDAEKGEGVPLSEHYGVDGFPTFVLMNAAGEVVDRWSGYDEPKSFLESLRRATADPTTFAQKKTRFASKPTLEGAEKLAELSRDSGSPEEALRYYAEAQRLNAGDPGKYLPAILDLEVAAWKNGASVDEPRKTADAILARPASTAFDLYGVSTAMQRLASKAGDPAIHATYLDRALAAVERSGGDRAPELARNLRLQKALEIEKDFPKAVALKRASLPEGWQNDPEELNGFAWWCFKHEVALDEAQELAQKGADLAPAGAKKAMILDTLAEICNARGNCGDAAQIEARAAAEDPANEHYKERAVEFARLLAEKRGGPSQL